MKVSKALLVLTALLAVLSTACSDEDEPSEGGTETPAATSAPTGTDGTGTASPAPGSSVDLRTATPLFSVTFEDPADVATGVSALAAGDVNDDGIADLIMGAPFADGPENSREDAGEVYVVFGREGADEGLTVSVDDADITIYGGEEGDGLGFDVSSADLNGDGVDDVIAGAPGFTGGRDWRTDQGRAYVFWGSADLKGSVDLVDENAGYDFVVTGPEGFSRVGHAIASGDVNADGTADLILGAPFAGRQPGSPPGSPRKEAGEVYAVFGSASLAGDLSVAFDPPGFMVSADERFGQFGGAVAAGDVNGDGVDDIVVGGPQMDALGRPASGAVYVFFGSPDLGGRIGPEEADAAVYGAERDALGETVGTGDFDGDGRDELLVIARLADGPDESRGESGEVYILSNLSTEKPIDLTTDAATAVIYGADPGDLFSLPVAIADVDGDGRDDAALASAFADGLGNERTSAGEAFVIHGPDMEQPVDLRTGAASQVYVSGAEEQDQLGSGLAWGDFNGDGRLELAVSAAGGVVYVLELPGP